MGLHVDQSVRKYSTDVKVTCTLDNGPSVSSGLFSVEIEPLCQPQFIQVLDPDWTANNAAYAINDQVRLTDFWLTYEDINSGNLINWPSEPWTLYCFYDNGV